MTKKTDRLLLDHEKQTTPLTGEVSLEEAQRKAAVFAVQENPRINTGKEKRKR